MAQDLLKFYYLCLHRWSTPQLVATVPSPIEEPQVSFWLTGFRWVRVVCM
jgi:hypothetical protein